MSNLFSQMFDPNKMGSFAGRSADAQQRLCGWLPTLDFKPLIDLATSAPMAFIMRNIFPAAQQLSGGNPNGLLTRLLRALQAETIRDIKGQDISQAMAKMSYDDNFKGSMASAMNVKMQSLPNMNMPGGGMNV